MKCLLIFNNDDLFFRDRYQFLQPFILLSNIIISLYVSENNHPPPCLAMDFRWPIAAKARIGEPKMLLVRSARWPEWKLRGQQWLKMRSELAWGKILLYYFFEFEIFLLIFPPGLFPFYYRPIFSFLILIKHFPDFPDFPNFFILFFF